MASTRVEHVMGTAVGVEVRGDRSGDPVLDAVLDGVFAHLRDIDARFSTYRDDSEISRLARGELAESDCSPDVRHVLAACDQLAVTTGGAFDARRQPAAGGLDPSAYVKGWAVEEAAWLLDDAGVTDYMINAGGDVVARGQAAPGRPWRVGVRHPVEAAARRGRPGGLGPRGGDVGTVRARRPHRRSPDRAAGRERAPEHDRRRVRASGSWMPTRPRPSSWASTASAGSPRSPSTMRSPSPIDGRVVRTAGMDRYLASAA